MEGKVLFSDGPTCDQTWACGFIARHANPCTSEMHNTVYLYCTKGDKYVLLFTLPFFRGKSGDVKIVMMGVLETGMWLCGSIVL